MIEIVVTLLILCVVSLCALQVYFNALSAEKQRVEESRLALLNACIRIQSLRRSVIARRVFIDRLLEKRRLEFVARRKLAICKVAFAGLMRERAVNLEVRKAKLAFEERRRAIASAVFLHVLFCVRYVWAVVEVLYVSLVYAVVIASIFVILVSNVLMCISFKCIVFLRRAFKFASNLTRLILTDYSGKVTVEAGPRRVWRNGRAETNKFVRKCMEKVRKIRAGIQE